MHHYTFEVSPGQTSSEISDGQVWSPPDTDQLRRIVYVDKDSVGYRTLLGYAYVASLIQWQIWVRNFNVKRIA